MRISDWSSDVCSSDLRSISGACRSGSREPPARPVPQPDKFGADWEVFDSLRLRGTYGTGFRIPNVPELFGGVAEGDRKRVVSGKSVSVSVDLGGRRIIKKKKTR